MSEDECDYMSDDFLAKLTQTENRPGLKKTTAEKKEHEKWKKRELKLEEQRAAKRIKKSAREVEHEAREDGLQKELDSSNKGFAMLAKMGFKPGTSLGKDNSGRKEPIPINLKEGRSGLGRDAAEKRLRERKMQIMVKRAAQLVSDFDPAAFRAQMREKHMARRTESDLWKAQKSCRQLDLAKEFDTPMEAWFWPKEKKQKSLLDEEEEEEEVEEEVVFSTEEQLEMVVEYLRLEHVYCLFCAISFHDVEDMTANCPGPTREDHDDL